MVINNSHVLVFKTNISTESEKDSIKPLLLTKPAIIEWSVDTEDIDCVLRVVSEQPITEDIIQLLTNSGFICRELE